ncbi:hypothetical protein WJX77_005282 [Trebouxia sp. C0004]
MSVLDKQPECTNDLEASLQSLRLLGAQAQPYGTEASVDYKAMLIERASSIRDQVMVLLNLEWHKLSPSKQEDMLNEKGGSYSRWPCWNYDSLSLQRDYVQRKFVQTAGNVYDALIKAQIPTDILKMGSCLEVVVLGCGPAPEMLAVKVFLQQYGRGASAKFRLVDNVNWDLAWSVTSSTDCITRDKVDLKLQDQSWWHQLAHAQIIIGWYVHEVLTDELTESILKKLMEHRAIILLGCPAAG